MIVVILKLLYGTSSPRDIATWTLRECETVVGGGHSIGLTLELLGLAKD